MKHESTILCYDTVSSSKKSLKIPNRKSQKKCHAIAKRKKTDLMIYKTLHRKLKIERHDPNYKPDVNSETPEG